MPTESFSTPGSIKDNKELLNELAKLNKKLDYLFNRAKLDTKNLREIAGWLVSTNALMSKDKDVGMSTEDTDGDDIRFWAGDAKDGNPNFVVTKSGIMTAIAALIMSAAGYPRVEMNNETNLIAAFQDALNAIRIVPSSMLGKPTMEFYSGGSTVGYLQDNGTDIILLTLAGMRNIQQSSGKDYILAADEQMIVECPEFYMNGYAGYSGYIDVITDVDFETQSVDTKRMRFQNGICYSIS